MTPRRILIGGWLLFQIAVYPGFLDQAGADMLFDSRIGLFDDRRSPMMTELWRVIGVLISGPAGMLALQSLLLLFGSYHLLRRALSERGAAIAAVCVLLFPPTIATTGWILPDTQLASFLVAATALLLAERRCLRLVGLGLLVIACGLRDGAAFAVLPIVVATFLWRDGAAGWRRYAIATGAWLAAALLATGLNWLFADDHTRHDAVALAMTDVVGTLRYSQMSDEEARPLLANVALASSSDLQRRANEIYGRPLFYAASERRLFEPAETDDQRAALVTARRAMMRAQPRAYLAHRWHTFAAELGPPRLRMIDYVQFVPSMTAAEALAHAARFSLVQTTLLRVFSALAHPAWSRPLWFLMLALVLFPLAILRKTRLATLLLGSALAYEAALFFVTSRPAYEDSHWLMIAPLLATILIGASARSRSTASRDAPGLTLRRKRVDSEP